MGLFDNIRQKKEIERLERAVRETPSPKTYSTLIKKYRETEDMENALRVAQQGVERFHDSDAIFDIYSRLRKSQAHNEIEALKKIIEERPNPSAFAQLAEIYKDLREEDMAMKYCRQSIEMFPNDDSPYLIVGQLRLLRYYKDLLVKDGQIAVENLEKACEINSRNYKALLELGKFYLQIGASSKAREKLVKILRFAPEDEAVKNMLEITQTVSKPPHEDIDILLQLVEDEGRLAYILDKSDQPQAPVELSPEICQEVINKIKDSDGLSCLFVCDNEGSVIAYHSQEGIDPEMYYEVTFSILQTVQDSSRQMDMGRFQRTQIEGPFGSIHMIAVEGAVYVAFAIPEVKPEAVYRRIQRLISQVSLQLKQGVPNA